MNRTHPFVPRRAEAGMSLIELMIALLIGTVLILGLVQVFSASRAAYQLSQGIARNQESARFALDFLSRDLRMIGHAGCVNDQSLLRVDGDGSFIGGNVRSLFMTNAQRDANSVAALPFPLRFDVAVQGFEAASTAPGDSVELDALAAGDAGDWDPALPAELAALAPVTGSDILVLRFLSAEQAPAVWAPGPPVVITYPATSGEVATGGNGLFALSDCVGTAVFQASAAPSGTQMTVQATGLNQSELSYVSTHDSTNITTNTGGAALHRAESVAYYVRLNAQRVPALYRARWTSAPGGGSLDVVQEELVEGVESMQLLFGEDENSESPALPPTGNIVKANTADVIGDESEAERWRRVGAVQLGLLVRGGGEERAAAARAEVPPSVLQVEMVAPADGHYRSVYETTVALRNRLFGN